MKENGDVVQFLKQKNYEMVNNNLGSGSFGKTVLLKDPFIDELFVAKKYEPHFSDDKEVFFGSFLQEIKIMYKLSHKNVVRIFDYYPYETIFTGYIIMEYIDGRNISDYFDDYVITAGENDTSPDEVFTQLIDAFVYIESKRILHRDIREGNILIDRNGAVKVIDFGLGKTFLPVDTSSDSMVEVINRSGLEKLPNEYFTGRYTSRTDMFYLAELFHRLLLKSELMPYFSYCQILDRMMEEQENKRYGSFNEIRDAIDKKDFSSLSISDDDKEIYQAFSNALFKCIASYTPEKEFVQSVDDFVERLRNVIRKNCFEYIVQNNSDLVFTVVKGGFKYYKMAVHCSILTNFLDWFERLTTESKNLVFNNILNKISSIPTEYEGDLPF